MCNYQIIQKYYRYHLVMSIGQRGAVWTQDIASCDYLPASSILGVLDNLSFVGVTILAETLRPIIILVKILHLPFSFVLGEKGVFYRMSNQKSWALYFNIRPLVVQIFILDFYFHIGFLTAKLFFVPNVQCMLKYPSYPPSKDRPSKDKHQKNQNKRPG